MAKQTVRKVQTSKVADFDDQLWPINCAILILAGFVAGIIIATSRFDDPRLLSNAWFRLATVVLAVGLLFWAIVWLQGKMIRRIQLCVLISLLVHLWMAMYLHERYLALVAQRETQAARRVTERYEQMTVPDYHWEHIEQPEQHPDFQKPLPTETPKPTESEAVEQKDNRSLLAEKKPVAKPEPPSRQQPSAAELRRAELTSPRRAQRAAGAQISRQEWKHRPVPGEPIPRPQLKPQGEQSPAAPGARVAAVERRQTETPAFQRRIFQSEPTADRQLNAIRLARRDTQDQPLPDIPATAKPTRQFVRPAEVPRTEAAAPRPVEAARQPRPSELSSNTPAVSRRRVDTPDARKQTTEPAAAVRLPAMSNAARLPSTLARRAAASQREPSAADATPSAPGTLARAAGGISLPSAVIPSDSRAARPAAAGGTPASRIEATGKTVVTRSRGRAPTASSPAAAGVAELAIGSTQIVARGGQPRATGDDRPSVALNSPVRRIARAATAGSSLATMLGPAIAPAPSVASASSGAGGPNLPAANPQATSVTRGGSAAPATTRPSTGSGPPGSSGAPGVIGIAQLARVTRYESAPSELAGGGVPMPGRKPGRALAPEAAADVPQLATTTPSGGKAAAAPLEAQPGGQQRQVAGLPGSLRSRAAAGAIASMASRGVPLPAAAARRAVASQPKDSGSDLSPGVNATLARAKTGINLPAAAVPVENATESGTGGVAVAKGGLTSNIEAADLISVRRSAAAAAPTGQKTAARGTAEFSLGTAQVVALAGRLQAGGEGLPTLAATASGPRIGRSTGRMLSVPADVPQIASTEPGASQSEGAATASPPVQPGQIAQQRQTAGLPGEFVAKVPIDGAVESGPAATTPGVTTGPRRLPRGKAQGPSLAAEVGAGPLAKTNTPGLPRGLAETIDQQPTVATGDTTAEPRLLEVAAGMGLGEPSRSEGGLPVQIAAALGQGGLSHELSPEVGIPSRRARPQSEVIHAVARRFVIERSGGRLAIDGQVREPVEAFGNRDPGRRGDIARTYGGTEGTEKAVEMGLDFFARHQFPDGHWSLDKLPSKGKGYEDAALGQIESDSAATGLALLSYLGAGYTHLDDKHRTVVRRGLDWLVRNQKPDGDLFTGGTPCAWLYSHGIAAIALCEGYGMTRDPELREPAQKAIQFILDSQHPTEGGWRYKPRGESDTSVSGWQLMALKSAQMAGLEVPADTLDKVAGWLDKAQEKGGARYAYNPNAADTPEQRDGLRPNLAMTAEGLLMRMYHGWKRDKAALIEGAEYLKSNLPEVGTEARPLRNVYYWYYATQVMFQMQGDYWKAWNDKMQPLLQKSQTESGPLAGSWHPTTPIRDRWGHAGGRHYVTAMNILMLEVYYRHLPLFQLDFKGK